MSRAAASPHVAAPRTRVHRWCLAAAGLVLVGVGGVGVVVPGLPTTIFLLAASWCFARSCPWLEERLLRRGPLAGFIRHLEPGGTMPRRARVTATVMMWIAIAVSSLVVEPAWVAGVLAGAGVIGTWCIWRFRREPRETRETSLSPSAS